jgi:hypothetical protein
VNDNNPEETMARDLNAQKHDDTLNVFAYAEANPTAVTPPRISGPEGAFARSYLTGAGFALTDPPKNETTWNAVHGGGVRPAGSTRSIGRVEHYRASAWIPGEGQRLAIVSNPAAIDTLTLLTTASATTNQSEFEIIGLAGLAAAAGNLAGRGALLEYLAAGIEETEPQIAVQMRDAAGAAHTELAGLNDLIRGVVRDLAHNQAQADIDTARVRAVTATAAAAIASEGMHVNIPDPTLEPITWEPDARDSSTRAQYQKAVLDAHGYVINTPRPRETATPDHDSNPWIDEAVEGASDGERPRERPFRHYLKNQALIVIGKPASELDTALDAARWVDVTDLTSELMVKAGFHASAQQRARAAAESLASVGETDERLNAELAKLDNLETGMRADALAALANDVTASVRDVAASLTTQAAAVTAALDAAPPVEGLVTVTAPGEVTASWLAAGVPPRAIVFHATITRAVPYDVLDTLTRVRRTFEAMTRACTDAGMLNPPAEYLELITTILAAVDTLPRAYDALALDARHILSENDQQNLADAWNELDTAFKQTEAVTTSWQATARTPAEQARRKTQNAVSVFRRVTAEPGNRATHGM